jgi:hypothetical protein
MQPAQVGPLSSPHPLRGYAVLANRLSVAGKPLVKFVSKFCTPQNRQDQLRRSRGEIQITEWCIDGTCYVGTFRIKYPPASAKIRSGDHAASAGGSWLKFPIASNKLDTVQ